MPKLLQYYIGGEGSLGTPKSDHVICARPITVFDKDTQKSHRKKVKVHNTWLENPFYRVTDVEAPGYQTSMASHVKNSHLWSQTAQHVLKSILLYNSLN